MTAGYSNTPLAGKLGIKGETRLFLINPPPNYFELLNLDPRPCMVTNGVDANVIHLFVKSTEHFQFLMKQLVPVYKKNTSVIIWVSWYKKASGIATDITEDVIRDYSLGHGLVDVKVCAVSDIWSGLKLVVPKAKR